MLGSREMNPLHVAALVAYAVLTVGWINWTFDRLDKGGRK